MPFPILGEVGMRVFAISDLHLSGAAAKPMDIFGSAWANHCERIAKAWKDLVSQDDLVLLPGDFSWAMRLNDALVDLMFLDALPGTKVLIRGNHDYWWDSLSKVRAVLPPSVFVIQNDCFSFNSVHVAGTRGWICPGSANFSIEDKKVYERELIRLNLSLSCLPNSGRKLAMLHYPPFNESRSPSGFTELIEKAGIELVVYGHLHAKSCKGSFEGTRNKVEYQLVSADHLEFAPKLILEI